MVNMVLNSMIDELLLSNLLHDYGNACCFKFFARFGIMPMHEAVRCLFTQAICSN